MLKKEKQIENSVLIAFLFGSFDSEISFFLFEGEEGGKYFSYFSIL